MNVGVNEWLDWTGDVCPVPANTRVEVQLHRDDRAAAEAYHTEHGPIEAGKLFWDHIDVSLAGRIIAYRVVKP